MAIVKDNTITKGISGLIGKDLLFQNRNGNTYVYKKFKVPTKWSARQKENRTKFARASSFASEAMEDPKRKEEYKQLAKQMGLTNAYTAAVTEYMRKPEIEEPDLTMYDGRKGDKIIMQVRKKDFDVEKVEVIITDDQGNVIESGISVKTNITKWSYHTFVNTEKIEKLFLSIKATERTGNYVIKQFLIRD